MPATAMPRGRAYNTGAVPVLIFQQTKSIFNRNGAKSFSFIFL
jgi:hypothetical protein